MDTENQLTRNWISDFIRAIWSDPKVSPPMQWVNTAP